MHWHRSTSAVPSTYVLSRCSKALGGRGMCMCMWLRCAWWRNGGCEGARHSAAGRPSVGVRAVGAGISGGAGLICGGVGCRHQSKARGCELSGRWVQAFGQEC